MALSSDKYFEDKLLEYGNRLLPIPSSVDELLHVLDQIENCLTKVQQSPPKSMQNALSPSLKALISNELLSHADIDVKVAVASCISEITRITAPDAPYNDDQMKGVFQLIVLSFEQLSEKLSRSYDRRISILETVSKVRSCVLMLDLECDTLIIEMFQHFLKSVRDDHPETVFSSMETIMTLVLEESEDISEELLFPILSRLKKDNKECLPVARKLAKKVLVNCVSKIKPYLIQAVKSSGFILKDYSIIVSAICLENYASTEQSNDTVPGENQGNKESLAIELSEKASEDAQEIAAEVIVASEDISSKAVMSNGVTHTVNDDSMLNSHSLKMLSNVSQSINESEAGDRHDTPKLEELGKKLEQSSKRMGKNPNVIVDSTNPSVSSVDSDKESEKLLERNEVHNSPHSSHDAALQSENEKGTDELSPPRALDNETLSPSGSLPDENHSRKTGQKNKRVSSNQGTKSSMDVPKIVSRLKSDSELEKQVHVELSLPKALKNETLYPSGSLSDKIHPRKSGREKKEKRSIRRAKLPNDVPKTVSNLTNDSEHGKETHIAQSLPRALDSKILGPSGSLSGEKHRKRPKKSGRTKKIEGLIQETKPSADIPKRPAQLTSVSGDEKETNVEVSSPKAPDSKTLASSWSLSGGNRRGRPKKKDIAIQEPKQRADVPKKVSEITSDSEVTPQRHAGKIKANLVIGSESKTPSTTDTVKKENKSGNSEVRSLMLSGKVDSRNNKGGSDSSAVQRQYKKERQEGKTLEINVAKSLTEDSGQEMDILPKSAIKSTDGQLGTAQLPIMNSKKKWTSRKEKVLNASLVGSKIEVWWPDDDKYYDGVVDSFDSLQKKHRILYTDGDEEILDLKNEIWRHIGDNAQNLETDRPSADVLSEIPKKKAKINFNQAEGKMDISHKSAGVSSSKSKPASMKKGRGKAKASAAKTIDKMEDINTSKSKSSKPGSKTLGNAPKLASESEDSDVIVETLKTGKKSKLKTPKLMAGSLTTVKDNNDTIEKPAPVSGKSLDKPLSLSKSEAKSGKKRPRA